MIIKMFNFGFINNDKETKANLFCILDRTEQNEEKAKETKKKYPWQMRNDLYTKDMIIKKFAITELPSPSRVDIDDRICNYLANSGKLKQIINKTKWCKLPVFSELNTKRRKPLMIDIDEFCQITLDPNIDVQR